MLYRYVGELEDEADAEEYARSRRAVTELEKQERQKEARKNKENSASNNKNNRNGGGAIQREWFCQDCKKCFSNNPLRCVRARHRVKVERKLIKAKTQEEKRSALSNAKTEDGGLKLGSGIEWDQRWSRFS